MKEVVRCILFLLLMVILTGCNRNLDYKTDDTNNSTMEMVEEIDSDIIFDYQETILNNISGTITDYQITESEIYFIVRTINDTKEEFSLYSSDYSGSEIHQIIEQTSEVITCFYVSNNKILYVSVEENNLVKLNEYDIKTKVKTEHNMDKSIKYPKDNGFYKIIQNDFGIYIFNNNAIYLFDFNIKLVDTLYADNGIFIDAAVSGDKIVCVRDVYEGAMAYLEVSIIETLDKMVAKKQNVSLDYMSNNDYLVNCDENIIMYKTEEGLWSYNIESFDNIQLIDFQKSYIDISYAKNIEYIGDNKYIKVGNINNNPTIVLFNVMDEQKRCNRKKIYVGTLYADKALKQIVSDYNRKNRDTEVVIKEYIKISDDPLTQFNLDIATGNAPDIIDVRAFNPDMCINQDLLEDLSTYMENSRIVSKDDIIDSVLSVTERNGKIYYVASAFDIFTITAKENDINDFSGWNTEEMCSYIDYNGDNAMPFYSSENKSVMLEEFMGGGAITFVDYSTNECFFDGDNFKMLMKLCNEKGVDGDYDIEEVVNKVAKDINDGKVLFHAGHTAFNNIQVLKNVFGANTLYVGYPSEDRNGHYFNFQSCLGIYSNSANKEEAWQLLELMISEEYQYNNLDYDGDIIPTRKDCLKELERSMCATEPYYDKNNRKIKPVEGTWKWGQFEISIEPLSQDEVKQFEDLIYKTDKIYGQDWMLMNIIMEESAYYFNGERGLDETANIIQSRAQVYINEHY